MKVWALYIVSVLMWWYGLWYINKKANGCAWAMWAALVFLFSGVFAGLYLEQIIAGRHTHRCPPPTRQNIQKHWIEVHDANHKIANTLDSKMLDICSRECMPGYWEDMEEK